MTGRLLDGGVPVVGATVDSDFSGQALTDAQGRFSLSMSAASDDAPVVRFE